MSQRLNTMIHPKTGATLEPLWISPSGRVFWPIMGASPDDPADGEGGAGGADGSGAGNGENGSGSEGQGSGSGQGEGGENTDVAKTPEYIALMNRMQAADRRASAAEAKIKEAEDAKKDDVTKATEKVTELETSIKEKDGTIAELRLHNAFLMSNEHEWHDAEAALSLAQSNGYLSDVVKEDGTVDAALLKAALKKLATEKKFLVKAAGEGDGTPSGGPVGSGNGKGKGKEIDEEALRRQFPALNL
jgi:hypothetical protein